MDSDSGDEEIQTKLIEQYEKQNFIELTEEQQSDFVVGSF